MLQPFDQGPTMRFNRYILRALVADHFELFMTATGVLIAALVSLSSITRSHVGMALTFLVWLQGVLVWAVHRHNCLRHRQLVRKAVGMVQDRINNRLTAWVLPEEPITPERERALMGAAQIVASELRQISNESLRRWERRNIRFIHSYGEA